MTEDNNVRKSPTQKNNRIAQRKRTRRQRATALFDRLQKE